MTRECLESTPLWMEVAPSQKRRHFRWPRTLKIRIFLRALRFLGRSRVYVSNGCFFVFQSVGFGCQLPDSSTVPCLDHCGPEHSTSDAKRIAIRTPFPEGSALFRISVKPSLRGSTRRRERSVSHIGIVGGSAKEFFSASAAQLRLIIPRSRI